MPSDRETFFQLDSFAVIGNTSSRPFPRLTYRNLKEAGKAVFPVDLSGGAEIEGDRAFAKVAELPERVLGAIVEVPKAEVNAAVQQVAEAEIPNLWIHMGCDTPEALALAREKDIHVRHGTCAVMYTQQGFTVHSIHKGIMKLLGKF